MGGSKPIPASARKEPAFGPSGTNQPFVLTGADLYRLNCRSCHGADGKGSPPEINSLIGPVQAASATAFGERMKARGTEVSDEMAKEMAAQAEKGLRDRLQNGGKSMPPFKHLRGDEVEALLGYLDKLAGVPAGKSANLLVTESAARVGEHVAKGTCHICHDATGPGGGHMAMMRGIIPSLASLPQENSLNAFANQIHNGSSGMMMMMRGPRMPAFPYLTDEEIAAAYSYLAHYPPQP
jgi:mono/diheme cytochrome c family protein